MKYYHGSIVPNLKTLYPMYSPHGNAGSSCIYLTSTKELAVLYLWVRKFMWLTYSFDKITNKIVYTESFIHSLEEFYSDVKGYIYTCEVEGDVENKSKINNAITYYEPLEITDCETVENAYLKIIEYQRNNNIIIRKYSDLTDEEHRTNHNMIKNAIKNLELIKGKHPLSTFVERKFPDIWKEVLTESR